MSITEGEQIRFAEDEAYDTEILRLERVIAVLSYLIHLAYTNGDAESARKLGEISKHLMIFGRYRNFSDLQRLGEDNHGNHNALTEGITSEGGRVIDPLKCAEVLYNELARIGFVVALERGPTDEQLDYSQLSH